MLNQKTEAKFAEAFIESQAISSISPHGCYIRELETLHGRPDLVIFDTPPIVDVAIRRAIYRSPSTRAFSYVFLTMKSSRKSLDEVEISRITGLSLSYTNQVIKSLLYEGLAVILKNNRYKLHKTANIPYTKIVSIEFKLNDWKKAIKQSIRHRAFADSALIIMPMSKKLLLLKNRILFYQFGISVAVFDDETGQYETLYDAESSKLSELSHLDVLGRLWLSFDDLPRAGSNTLSFVRA